LVEAFGGAPDPTAEAARPRVLVVDDDAVVAETYAACLSRRGLAVARAASGEEALALLGRVPEEMPEDAPEDAPVDVVLLDLGLPGLHGLEVLARITDRIDPPAVVVVTGDASIAVAVEAMRAGAFDFLVKPVGNERLVAAVAAAVEARRDSAPPRAGAMLSDAGARLCDLIGASPPMQAVYRVIERAAPSRASLFLTGESGTGKDLCAQAIHCLSPRRARPFVAVNCAAIPRELMESEIFGHVRGAFTGAVATREGAAGRADGGTLFFDEICEMDLALQGKLLRFVQSGSFQKVGSGTTERVDVRFICATNRDPFAEVKAGRFREDLYYCLHVIPIELPPLRIRGNDVITIARHLLDGIAAEEGRPPPVIAPEAEALLASYPWPGNVRELQNLLRRLLVLNGGATITPAMLPPEIAAPGTRREAAPADPGAARGPTPDAKRPIVRPLWMTERDTIEEAIAHCQGNVPRAAALLEISDSTIYRKRQRWAAREDAATAE